MKNKTIQEIRDFVAGYQKKKDISTSWDVPLLGFAAADDPLFEQLKTAVSPTHAVPKDLLENAGTVVSFFLPFSKSVTSSGRRPLPRIPRINGVFLDQLQPDLHDVTRVYS